LLRCRARQSAPEWALAHSRQCTRATVDAALTCVQATVCGDALEMEKVCRGVLGRFQGWPCRRLRSAVGDRGTDQDIRRRIRSPADASRPIGRPRQRDWRVCASGWHTCSIMMRIIVDRFILRSASLSGIGLDEIKWLVPVRPGDLLTVRARVLEKRAHRTPGVGLASRSRTAVFRRACATSAG
jgi:MaoC like domain